jgi:diguanylate cyclase (GGDEF)-like protein
MATVGRLFKKPGSAVSYPESGQAPALEQRLPADLFNETASLIGEEFVRGALNGLRRALQVRYVLVAETVDDCRLRIRECCSEDREVPVLEYDLAGSPCERVMGRRPCCYPAGVKGLFPGHRLVQTLNVEGYLGVPLFGHDDRVTGLLALIHDAPLEKSDLAAAACQTLARRIGAEFERMRLERDLRRSERHYRELAFNDQLTGVSSRLSLMNRLDHALERARCSGHGVAVLFLDIDGFKRVNDDAGHDAGDQVLVDVARRIAGRVRCADTVARLGGDEFVILLERCACRREARVVAEQILCAFSRPFATIGRSWSLSASLGISLYEGSGLDARSPDVLKQADRAMYRAKQDGPGGYRFACPAPSLSSMESGTKAESLW